MLAVRDEFEARAFDDPAGWWPDQPDVIGGRDRSAGGSWCVSDVRTGVTALVLNRPEKRVGTPSRGLLPLLAARHRDGWTEHLDHREMAGFTLVLVAGAHVTSWEWTGQQLTRRELDAGLHVMTPRGVDPSDPLTNRLAPQLAATDWPAVLRQESPSSAADALFVRHDTPAGVYRTVFAQLIEAGPGRLRLRYARAPWSPDWTERSWRIEDGGVAPDGDRRPGKGRSLTP